MYNEILLQNLPLVIRRKILDFSSLQDDLLSSHSKIRNNSNNNNNNNRSRNTSSPSKRQNNDPRGSPVFFNSPSRHQQRNSSSRSPPSSPSLSPIRNPYMTSSQNEQQQRNFSEEATAMKNNKNLLSVTDSLTTMWDQELLAGKSNLGGGAGIEISTHWLDAMNPKISQTVNAKKLSVLSDQQKNQKAKFDQVVSGNNNKKRSSTTSHHQPTSSSLKSSTSTLDTVMNGLLNFPAPPCQLTLHQEQDFRRLLKANHPNLQEIKNKIIADRINRKNESNNNKMRQQQQERHHSRQESGASRFGGDDFPSYSRFGPSSVASSKINIHDDVHNDAEEQNILLFGKDNDFADDGMDDDFDLIPEERERLAELIMQNPVSSSLSNLLQLTTNTKELSLFLSDRDPRNLLLNEVNNKDKKNKKSFGQRQLSPERRQFQQKDHAPYSLKPTKDPLYSDLEKCPALLQEFLCSEGGQSMWLFGNNQDPFLEPIHLSRKLLDRICAGLHSMLTMSNKMRNKDNKNNNVGEDDDEDITKSSSRYLPHLPLALVGPSRFIVPTSFADAPTSTQEKTNLLCQQLFTFFAKSLFLGRSRKPVLGEGAASNEEILFQMFALGGVAAVCQISGKSYHKSAAVSLGGDTGNINNENKAQTDSYFSTIFGGIGNQASSAPLSSTMAKSGLSSSSLPWKDRHQNGDATAASDGSASSAGSSVSSFSSASSSRSSNSSVSSRTSSLEPSGGSRRGSLQHQQHSGTGSISSSQQYFPRLNTSSRNAHNKHRFDRKKKFEKNSKTSNPFSGKCDSHRITSSSSTFASHQTPPPPMHFCFPSASAISDLLEGVVNSFSSVASYQQQKRTTTGCDISKLVSTDAAMTCLSYLAATHSTLARVAGFRLPSLICSTNSTSSSTANEERKRKKTASSSFSSFESLPFRQKQTLPTSLEAVHRALLVAKTIISSFSIGCRGRLGMANPSVPLILRCEMAVERRRVFIGGGKSENDFENNNNETYAFDHDNNLDDDDDNTPETDHVMGISIRWVPELVDIRSILKKVADERRPTLVPSDEVPRQQTSSSSIRGEVPTLATKPLKPLAMKLLHCQTVIASQSLHSLFDFEEVFSAAGLMSNQNMDDPSTSSNANENNQNQNQDVNTSATASCGMNSDYEEVVTDALMNILHLVADLELASEDANRWRTSHREILTDTNSGINQQQHQHQKQQKLTIEFCEATKRSITSSVKLGLSLDDETTSLFVAHILDDRLSLNALRARLRSFAADVMYSLLLWLFDASAVWVPSCGSFSTSSSSSTFKKQSSSVLKASLYKAVIRFVGSGEKSSSPSASSSNATTTRKQQSETKMKLQKEKDEREQAALLGGGILDQMFEDDDVEENYSADRVLSEHDLGGLGTTDFDFEAIELDEQQSNEEQSFLNSFLTLNETNNNQQQQSFGPYFQSVGNFSDASRGASVIPKQQKSSSKKNNTNNNLLEKLKQELLSKFQGSTSTAARNLMPGLYSSHPLYCKMLRLPPNSRASKVYHMEQFAGSSAAAKMKLSGNVKAALNSNNNKNINNNNNNISQSDILDSELATSGPWNLWTPDTRERLLMANPTSATTTFTRAPRGRLLLNSSYASVFEQQTWRNISSTGVTPTSSDLIPPPAVLFFVPKQIIAERAIDTEMSLTSSVVREEKVRMEMMMKGKSHQNVNNSKTSESLAHEISHFFGFPLSSSTSDEEEKKSDGQSKKSFLPVDKNRNVQLRAVEFLWRNAVGLRGNSQKFFSVSSFLSQFWIIVVHHNWSRSRSRTSTLLLDRIFALSTPDGKTLKKDIFSFYKNNPSVAIQWICNILSLSYAEANSSSPSFVECRTSADLVVVKKLKSTMYHHEDEDDEEQNKMDDDEGEKAKINGDKIPISVFVNGFDTFATLGFARKQALTESCVPLLNRFVFSASSLLIRWKRKEARLQKAVDCIQAFASAFVSTNHVSDMFRRRYVEARSHEICFGHGSALEERRLRSTQRHRDVLMNSVHRQRSMLENDLGISPYLTPPKSRRQQALDTLNSPELEVEIVEEEENESHQLTARDRLRSYLGKKNYSNNDESSATTPPMRKSATTPPPTPTTPRHLRPSLLQLAEAAQFETPIGTSRGNQIARRPSSNTLFGDPQIRQQRSSSSPTRASGRTTQFFDNTHSSVTLLGSSVAANSLEPGMTPSTINRAFGRALSKSVATIIAVEVVERQRMIERQESEFRRVVDSWSDLSPTLKHGRAEENSRNAIYEKWVLGLAQILDLFVEPTFREIILRSERTRRRYLRVFNNNVSVKIILQQEERERKQLEKQETRVSMFLKNHSVMYTLMENLQDMLNLNTDKRTQFERDVAAAAQKKISSLMMTGSGKDANTSGGAAANNNKSFTSSSVQKSSGNSRIANVVRQAVQAEKEPLHVRIQRSVYLSEADCLRSVLEFTPNILQAEENAREQIMIRRDRGTIITRESTARKKLERNCMSFLLRFGLEFQLFLLPLVERDLRGSISALGALYYSDVGKRFIIQRNELAHWEQIMKTEAHEKREIDREAQMWDTLFDDSYASPMRLLEMLERDRNAVQNLMSRVQPIARSQQTAGMRHPGLLPHQQHQVPHNHHQNQQKNNSDYYANIVSAVAAARRRQHQNNTSGNVRSGGASSMSSVSPSRKRTATSLDRFLENENDDGGHSAKTYFDEFGDEHPVKNNRSAYQNYFGHQQQQQQNNTLTSAPQGQDDRVVFLSNRVHQGGHNDFSANNNNQQNQQNQRQTDFNDDDMSPNTRILRSAGAVARPASGMTRSLAMRNNNNSSTSRSSSRDRFGQQHRPSIGTSQRQAAQQRTQKGKVPLTTEQQLLRELKGTQSANSNNRRRL